LDLKDVTYDNEVRILSTLQRLEHPNIIQLVACYTYNDKHHLVSPYISGGTLRKLLEKEKSSGLCREDLFYSIAGLASAIWALHEFVVGDAKPAHKGHHQDLHPDNILVDGDKLILADFGLSSIKSIGKSSGTPFKGRRDYYQAPECADLTRPYKEYDTTRSTDIWAFGCITTDLLIHFKRGPGGLKLFANAREFHISPIDYRLYHKGKEANAVVQAYLEEVAKEDESQSFQDFTELIIGMLSIRPEERPSAAVVTATIYIATITAYTEEFIRLFGQFSSSMHKALVEKERYLSWFSCQDVELYATSSGPTPTSNIFNSTIEILRQMKIALENMVLNSPEPDDLSFLELRSLNSQLLNMLSSERRSDAWAKLESIMLSKIDLGELGVIDSNISSEFANNPEFIKKLRFKQMVSQMQGTPSKAADLGRHRIEGPIESRKSYGRCRLAKVRDDRNNKSEYVFLETIQYQDPYRLQGLYPRLLALCNLLSSEGLIKQLHLLPFHGVYDNVKDLRLEVMYKLPPGVERNSKKGPIHPSSLHDLLREREPQRFPSLEDRFALGLKLAESLAAFHDVNWFHKNFTSYNILFFPEANDSLSKKYDNFHIIGFEHSRSVDDDLTEGPLQDQKLQRYHDPSYICKENKRFRRFRPQFDYYSLGVLLLEIGFWNTIDAIMDKCNEMDNEQFSKYLIDKKLAELSFYVGSKYASIVRECLVGISQHAYDANDTATSDSTRNVALKESVVIPLKRLSELHSLKVSDCTPKSPTSKRKRESGEDPECSPMQKRKAH